MICSPVSPLLLRSSHAARLKTNARRIPQAAIPRTYRPDITSARFAKPMREIYVRAMASTGGFSNTAARTARCLASMQQEYPPEPPPTSSNRRLAPICRRFAKAGPKQSALQCIMRMKFSANAADRIAVAHGFGFLCPGSPTDFPVRSYAQQIVALAPRGERRKIWPHKPARSRIEKLPRQFRRVICPGRFPQEPHRREKRQHHVRGPLGKMQRSANRPQARRSFRQLREQIQLHNCRSQKRAGINSISLLKNPGRISCRQFEHSVARSRYDRFRFKLRNFFQTISMVSQYFVALRPGIRARLNRKIKFRHFERRRKLCYFSARSASRT